MHLLKVDYSVASGSDVTDILALEQIENMDVNVHVNIIGKVVAIHLAEKVKGGSLTKQDFELADGTAVCRGVAWERDVGKLKEGVSYKLLNVGIRSFQNSKYVSLSTQSMINEISDIGEVINVGLDEKKGGVKTVYGEIVMVVGIDEYSACRSCGAKVVQTSLLVGECSKCGQKMKIGKCKKDSAARFIIEDENGVEFQVSAFTKVIEDIIEDTEGNDISEKLLNAPHMTFTIKKDVVSSVAM